jgi:hypothetical protein
MLTDTIFFLGILPSFQKPALFSFSGKEAANLVDHLNQATLSHWVPQKQ